MIPRKRGNSRQGVAADNRCGGASADDGPETSSEGRTLTAKRHHGHGPKRIMNGRYDPNVLEGLRRKLEASGRQPPHPSFKHIDFHPSWGAWRVQLPGICGSGITFFGFGDYGGPEAALIEAQFHRDEAYAKQGLDPYMRVRDRYTKQQRGSLLSIQEITDPRRNNAQYVVGSWMVTVGGKARQVKVRRVFGRLRTREEAWEIVESAVRDGMAAEADRQRLEHEQKTQ